MDAVIAFFPIQTEEIERKALPSQCHRSASRRRVFSFVDLRFSFSRFNTKEEIDYLVEVLADFAETKVVS